MAEKGNYPAQSLCFSTLNFVAGWSSSEFKCNIGNGQPISKRAHRHQKCYDIRKSTSAIHRVCQWWNTAVQLSMVFSAIS